jgi:myo-inositol-1(or 4)-monophosphatase
MNAWDCLAAMLLIEEAGGIVETSGMSTVLEDGTMVIAGGTGVFDKVRALSAQAFNL